MLPPGHRSPPATPPHQSAATSAPASSPPTNAPGAPTSGGDTPLICPLGSGPRVDTLHVRHSPATVGPPLVGARRRSLPPPRTPARGHRRGPPCGDPTRAWHPTYESTIDHGAGGLPPPTPPPPPSSPHPDHPTLLPSPVRVATLASHNATTPVGMLSSNAPATPAQGSSDV